MHTNQTVIQRAIQLILLISLAPVHTISIAKPSIKIDKAAKAHHHAGHKKTASKAKPKGSSNTHSHHPFLTIRTAKLHIAQHRNDQEPNQ